MNMSKYLDLFLAESREHLSAIEDDMARLEQEPDDRSTLNELFRHAHSIKGMAASMGFRTVAELAHGIEDVLDRVKQGQAPFDLEMRSVLGAGFDVVERMIESIGAGGEPDHDVTPLLESLRGLGRPPSAPREVTKLAEAPIAPRPGGPGGRSEGAELAARSAMSCVVVEIEVSSESPLPAARAAVAIKRLEARGRVVSADPSLEDLLRGGRPARLTVVVETSVPLEQLREDIAKVPDIVPIRVAALASGEDVAAPPSTGPSYAPIDPRDGGPSPPARAADGGAPAGTDSATPANPTAEPPSPSQSPTPIPVPDLPAATSAGTADASASVAATVRIPARSLDRFLDTIGELLVQRGRLAGLLKGRSDRALDISLERLKSLVDRLYGDVMSLRMLPFETIAQRFTRSVRELAGAQRKRVSLRIAGREVMLDRSMLDELIDPINHVLRNAVDHGIESPAERIAAGKPEGGAIAIQLERTGDSVTIRIEDDGRGMDPEQIRQAAVRKGFLTRDAVESVDDSAALMLTTIPGFSTRDKVTDVSGRGVGMDVVRTRVERLGGRLALRSRLGSGLTVEMRLPLTIVVVQAFIVEAGARNWAVPVSSVRRTFEVSNGQISQSAGRHWADVGGERIALYDLGGTLGLPARAEAPTGPRQALIATEADRSVAVTVDRIVGRREIVVKPLRQPLEELRGFSGATILEDGEIALIVDLLSLARY